MAHPVKTYFPKTRLAELALRSGGIEREAAIENAQKSVEELRPEGDALILTSIGEIQEVARGAVGGKLTEPDLHRVLRVGDAVVTLAGTFGYAALDRVVRSMCDLVDGLIGAGLRDAAPVAIHAHSMHLLRPGATTLSEPQVVQVESELAKLLAHYNFSSLAFVAGSEMESGVATTA